MSKWKYEVSLEIPNINESGSNFSRIAETYNEHIAFNLLREGRNRLERTGMVNGKVVTQVYEYGNWT